MKLSETPSLGYALAYLGYDMGARLNVEAEIPGKWQECAKFAEGELSKFTPAEIETLAAGEEREQEVLKLRALNADKLLLDAFDGDLSDVLFTASESLVEHLGVEVDVGFMCESLIASRKK